MGRSASAQGLTGEVERSRGGAGRCRRSRATRSLAGGGSAAAGDAQKGDGAPGGRRQQLFVDVQEVGKQGREEKLGPATCGSVFSGEGASRS
jgi:hypothetical protein